MEQVSTELAERLLTTLYPSRSDAAIRAINDGFADLRSELRSMPKEERERIYKQIRTLEFDEQLNAITQMALQEQESER